MAEVAKSLALLCISEVDCKKASLKSVFDSERRKGEGMEEEDVQEQEHSAISEEDYTRTIYTVTLSRKLYDALKKLTIESENQSIGDTIVQFLEENPRIKKELKEL